MKDYQVNKGRRTAGTLAFLWPALMLCAYAPQSQATCTLGPGIAQNVLNIAFGNIAVPLNTANNVVLAERQIPIKHTGVMLAICKSGPGAVLAEIRKGSSVGNYVYTTNIPGIGIRIGIYLSGAGGVIQFPFIYPAGGGGLAMGAIGRIHVQLIKISNNTGNGALEEGQYATMYSKDFPDQSLQVIVSGRTTTIITPSCTAAPTPPVHLGKVWKNLFSAVGSTAAEQRFNIKLNCREAKPELNAVYLRMDAKPDASGAPGVIALNSEANAATGVGIQILDRDRQPVTYGQGALVGVSKDGAYDVLFHARYYQTANQVTAGEANGSATFTLEYK
ncbi:fimbrial protein [Achromobacter sp.]|uniref:fimbrial protein n=1 Tax=Achromobacter sp. TaxID=134375 RepID=UPI002F944E72